MIYYIIQIYLIVEKIFWIVLCHFIYAVERNFRKTKIFKLEKVAIYFSFKIIIVVIMTGFVQLYDVFRRRYEYFFFGSRHLGFLNPVASQNMENNLPGSGVFQTQNMSNAVGIWQLN